jgi:signal peptidase II
MLAGGIGRLIDPVLNRGAVVEFMNIGLRNLCLGIFNVADSALMAGLGLLLPLTYLQNRSAQRMNTEGGDDRR